MKAFKNSILSVATLLSIAVSPAFAADAQTSASAGRGGYDGTSSATATFSGENGFATVESRSGRVNSARGVAVGLDRDGVAVSISDARATNYGPAVATNLNLSVGRDGRVSTSLGSAVAEGAGYREAQAGGRASIDRFGDHVTTSTAGGRTDEFGRVRAQTSVVGNGDPLIIGGGARFDDTRRFADSDRYDESVRVIKRPGLNRRAALHGGVVAIESR